MISKEVYDSYEMTIGIECHVQFNTKTKLFAAVDNDARGAGPNEVTSPICFGLPGVLPVLNKEAIELAIRAGHALNARVATFSKFDRKHYFYPDLPNGYQITQFDQPIVCEGSIDVPVGGEVTKVGITRAHLESDAGKSTHPAGKDYSLVDLNRAGTPLLEIVSEPDIHTPAQARAFVQELYLRMKYADVSNVDLFQGNMRFDVNLSVAKKGSKKLGTRSETKNLNSFRSVEKVAEYEFKRQIDLLEKGEEIAQETRGWDDAKMKTLPQRSKEDAHDYRYFPDPDLPPVVVEQSRIDKIKSEMPLMPTELRAQLAGLGLVSDSIETLLHRDREQGLRYIDTILSVRGKGSDEAAKFAANYIVNDFFGLHDFSTGEDASTEPASQYVPVTEQFIDTHAMVVGSELSSNGAVDLLSKYLTDDKVDAKSAAKDHDLLQSSDEGEIEAIVDEVITENVQAAQDVRDGEMKAVGFLVGQVMKASKGQANPQVAQKILRKKLQ